jgi:SAM-dependent methyltransferase
MKQEYFKRRLWKKAPQPIINALIKEVEEIAAKKLGKTLSQLSILDVGSGNGEYAVAFSKKAKKVVGVEPFTEAYQQSLKYIAKRKNLHFINEVIENVSIKEKFDIVLSLTTIEHMPHAEKSYRKVFSLMKKGGIMYLTAPNKLWPYEYHYRLPFLSWLPLPLASMYVRLTKRGSSYEDSAYARTYFGMKSLFDTFACSYSFKLPYDLSSPYIGCGSSSRPYSLFKILGIKLIARFPILWIFSKGFIMVIQKT